MLPRKILAFAAVTIMFGSIFPAFSMNRARIETRTDEAVSTFGVTGEGVIVAIIDRGIDWRSNDFRNEDGSTRIKYIFDMTDNSGSTEPGNTYGVGTIYDEAEINAALDGGPPLATRDAVGHGTSTTGIAAGNGRNTADRKYRGIAPKASIISVKFTSEGAPAHDGQPAESPFYNESLFPKALLFVRDKAAVLKMPVVMLANFGTINGPTDGTSLLSRTIDSSAGPGKPGIAFVTGTGDDGGSANHAGGTVTTGETHPITIQKNGAGILRLDLWYGANDRFDVSWETPSGNFGPYPAPANGSSSFNQTSAFTMYHNGSGRVFYGATNGKREIFIDITGPAGTYKLNLVGSTVANGRFDATLNPSRLHNILGSFTDNAVPGSIIDQATAFNNIAPNSYVLATNWVDIDGIPRNITGEGTVGGLWLGSSVGPTFDGRLGTDLSAPGDLVIASYSPTSYWATFRFNLVQDGLGLYGRAGAVSAAAPQVTGAIALMLEANPYMDAESIDELLHRSARSDEFTGKTPNPEWGYGKLDVYSAVELALSEVRVRGRILSPSGRPIAHAIVSLTDASGIQRTFRTNTFGYYGFEALPIGRDYEISVAARGYDFETAVAEADGDIDDFNFLAAGGETVRRSK